MVHHEHILRRFYPALVEEKPSGQRRIQDALDEIKAAAADLPLQQALDIGSAVMDIEAALASPSPRT